MEILFSSALETLGSGSLQENLKTEVSFFRRVIDTNNTIYWVREKNEVSKNNVYKIIIKIINNAKEFYLRDICLRLSMDGNFDFYVYLFDTEEEALQLRPARRIIEHTIEGEFVSWTPGKYFILQDFYLQSEKNIKISLLKNVLALKIRAIIVPYINFKLNNEGEDWPKIELINVSFGTVEPNKQHKRDLTIKNTGILDLKILKLRLEKGAEFNFDRKIDFPFTIQGKNQAIVPIFFQSNEDYKPFEDKLHILSDDPANAIRTLTLNADCAELIVEPPFWSVQMKSTDKPIEKEFKIINVSNQAIIINEWSVVQDAPCWSIRFLDGRLIIAKGESKPCFIKFTPPGPILCQDRVVIITNFEKRNPLIIGLGAFVPE